MYQNIINGAAPQPKPFCTETCIYGPLVVKDSFLRGSPIFSQTVAKRPPELAIACRNGVGCLWCGNLPLHILALACGDGHANLVGQVVPQWAWTDLGANSAKNSLVDMT